MDDYLEGGGKQPCTIQAATSHLTMYLKKLSKDELCEYLKENLSKLAITPNFFDTFNFLPKNEQISENLRQNFTEEFFGHKTEKDKYSHFFELVKQQFKSLYNLLNKPRVVVNGSHLLTIIKAIVGLSKSVSAPV